MKLTEMAMTPPADPIDDLTTEQPASRICRVLERADYAIASAARAVWRAITEGSAAYGMAEYAYFMDPHFYEDALHDIKADQRVKHPHTFGPRADAEFGGEF
jgi:hypothetical protein